MIIHLKANVDSNKARELAALAEAVLFRQAGQYILVTSSKTKNLNPALEAFVDEFFVAGSDIQLAGRKYRSETREVQIGNLIIGGNTNNTIMIAGPCSVESWEQLEQSAKLLKELGLTTLRAGAFKPRTSPYTFQGLGREGLKLLARAREEFGLNIISEVRDATHVDDIIAYADIVQIGAKAMYDHGILRKCGEIQKPVLLKRGFGSTLQEFVQTAEFILSGGNPNVILCERGIRTFEDKTRFTLDLCGVSYLKEYVNLPVVVDPSHAIGYRYGVPDLTRASLAMGVEGLLIETHPTPESALSDASQQLNFDEFRAMFKTLPPIAAAIGRNLV